MAIKNGNNRTVDIILSHMSFIKINDSENFRTILSKLTDLTSFSGYLTNLTT